MRINIHNTLIIISAIAYFSGILREGRYFNTLCQVYFFRSVANIVSVLRFECWAVLHGYLFRSIYVMTSLVNRKLALLGKNDLE
jgi:hypothetical protein